MFLPLPITRHILSLSKIDIRTPLGVYNPIQLWDIQRVYLHIDSVKQYRIIRHFTYSSSGRLDMYYNESSIVYLIGM